MVADDLIARLKTISGTGGVYDAQTVLDGQRAGTAPYLILHEISTTPEITIGDDIAGSEQRWQVSVIGKSLRSVRIMAQAVYQSLHGYTSDSIAHCSYASWPGTIREGEGSTREFHAPVDFMVMAA